MKMRTIVIISLMILLLCGCDESASTNSQSSKTVNGSNSIGMEFVSIPAGRFYMGSCKYGSAQKAADKKRQYLGQSALGAVCPSGGSTDNDARDDETPQHRVQITRSFQMGKYEVTVGQFKQFIVATDRQRLLTADFMQANSHGNNTAVSHVSWNDTQAFIKWLNKKEGRNYRLPTEAEWEYAARAGSNTVFSWGYSKSQIGTYAWYCDNAYGVGAEYAHNVGSKRPNAWGLYDMHGNVCEWCQDWYGGNYYQRSPNSDPRGPSSGSYRVFRGGGYGDYTMSVRLAFRNYSSNVSRRSDVGFRLSLPN